MAIVLEVVVVEITGDIDVVVVFEVVVVAGEVAEVLDDVLGAVVITLVETAAVGANVEVVFVDIFIILFVVYSSAAYCTANKTKSTFSNLYSEKSKYSSKLYLYLLYIQGE